MWSHKWKQPIQDTRKPMDNLIRLINCDSIKLLSKSKTSTYESELPSDDNEFSSNSALKKLKLLNRLADNKIVKHPAGNDNVIKSQRLEWVDVIG